MIKGRRLARTTEPNAAGDERQLKAPADGKHSGARAEEEVAPTEQRARAYGGRRTRQAVEVTRPANESASAASVSESAACGWLDDQPSFVHRPDTLASIPGTL
jgi:hypothetical protein